MNASEFVGKVFTEIRGMEVGSKEVYFHSGPAFAPYKMHHHQDCCESVSLDDVCGDPADLIGTPILEAYEEQSRAGKAKGVPSNSHPDESFTWTFCRLRTIKGTVTLKWYGSSNGYYSEEVEIDVVRPPHSPRKVHAA